MSKRFILIFIILTLIISLYACASDTPVNAEYLSGSYMNDDLNVGYNFFPDGKGFQFISDSAFQIEYNIINGYINITTIFEDSELSNSFTFKKNNDNIIINGVTYVIIPDTTSDIGISNVNSSFDVTSKIPNLSQ